MRIALGCMRLSTEVPRDDAAAAATLRAAIEAGINRFDTAHAYGLGEDDLGHNERVLARAWREAGRPAGLRVITKCGMRRDGGSWVPDGRAARVLEDAAASVEALDGLPVDLLLLHAPDRAVPIATAARALARAQETGLARAVGVSNVSRKQLEEAAAHAPVTAVEIALGAYDDLAIRSGVVAYGLQHGIEVLAYAPLGGTQRAPRLARDRVLRQVAARHTAEGAGPLDVFIAYVLAVRPELVPVVGVRRAETVARLALAARLALGELDLAGLDQRFPALGGLRRPPHFAARDVEVVMIAGVPGAGKSRLAESLVARGYERLNRDTVGGTLAGIARWLDDRLRAGATRVVVDNTYVTRASRHDVVRVASAHGARTRCLFLDTPLADAQVNAVLRMLDRLGRVPEPDEQPELFRREPAALAPRALQRATRDLEPPAADEGFAEIEVIRFARALSLAGRAALIVALDALPDDAAALERALLRQLEARAPGTPCLLYAWRPGIDDAARAALAAIAARVSHASGRAVDLGLCAHPPGPPICWCRPPLPALPLVFAHRCGVDLAASMLIGASAADRALARALGASFVDTAAA